jgi:uncharacterized protein (DUF1501 family)
VGVAGQASPMMVRLAEASSAATKTFVHVFLRGGADGLNMVVPYGEAEYYNIRREIAIPRPGRPAAPSTSTASSASIPASRRSCRSTRKGRLAIIPPSGTTG